MATNRYMVSFGGWWQCFNIDCCDDFTREYKPIIYFKWVNCMVCVLSRVQLYGMWIIIKLNQNKVVILKINANSVTALLL